MTYYSVIDIQRRLPDEESILDRLMVLRYGDVTDCPRCRRKSRFYRVRGRPVFSCRHCGHQISPMAGTIFSGTRIPMRKWFLALDLITRSGRGISIRELQRQLGVTYKTAWRMRVLLREHTIGKGHNTLIWIPGR